MKKIWGGVPRRAASTIVDSIGAGSPEARGAGGGGMGGAKAPHFLQRSDFCN